MTDWQRALCMAMGAIKCSPAERLRAFRLLHETGIAEKLGGKIAEATRAIMEENNGHEPAQPD